MALLWLLSHLFTRLLVSNSTEDNTDDNCNDKEISTQGVINRFRKDARPTVGKSETKCLIEQLVMQETFTR